MVSLAQETPTEREAARDVLTKMAELEKSLDVPAMVAKLTAPNPERMAAILYDFATHREYRGAVKREFDGIKALFAEYQEALRKTYTLPNVPDPR